MAASHKGSQKASRKASRKLRLLATGAAAGLLLGIAGCDSAHPAAAGSPGASTPARSASPVSVPPPTPAGPTAPTPTVPSPAGGPVPARFAATSVTFVSADEAFVLGTAPCAVAPCTAIVRTLNRGQSWRGLPAPLQPVGEPALNPPAVWGIRFATPEHGFVFGDGLWESTDGGERWIRDAAPAGGSVLSLAIVAGQVLALTDRCTQAAGCDRAGLLVRRALTGGSWRPVAKVSVGNLGDPDDLIATQAGVAAIVTGRDVLVTADGGVTSTVHQVPCPPPSGGPSVAVTSATGLALLCLGEGYTGHTTKQVYLSDDDGAHWTLAGAPSPDGDGGTIAATTTGDLAIATESAASWLFYSPSAGTSWRITATEPDGGMGWADLGFTTATDGVVVRGPADSDGNSTQRPGQLYLTSDAGATWYQVSF